MATLLTIALLNLLALGFAGWRLLRLQATARTLQKDIAQLAPVAAVAGPDLHQILGAEPDLITIEILNPMQLAARESWFAELFGKLTPSLVRRTVYDRASDIIVDELRKRGVEATVSIHRARG